MTIVKTHFPPVTLPQNVYRSLFKIGTVISFDPDSRTYTVRLLNDQIISGTRRIIPSEGNIAPISSGMRVLVGSIDGVPYIFGIVEPSVQNKHAGQSEVLPGEWVIHSHGGSEIGLVGEQTAYIRANSACQLLFHGLSNLVRLIAGNLQIQTASGRVEFGEYESSSMIRILGLFDREMNHPSQEGYDYLLQIGGPTDLSLVLGREETSFHFLARDGNADIFLKEDLDINAKNAFLELAGNLRKYVEGDLYTSVLGLLKEESFKRIITVGDDFINYVGNKYGLVSKEAEIKTTDSKMIVSVGSLTSLPGDGLKIEVYNGNITMKVAGTNIVIIGGDTPTDFVCKYNKLAQLLNQIALMFDAHTHPYQGGSTSPPSTPISSTVSSMLPAIKSNKLALNE